MNPVKAHLPSDAPPSARPRRILRLGRWNGSRPKVEAGSVAARPRREWRWLVYLLALLVCAPMLLIVPPPYSTALLLVLVAGSLVVAARDAELTPRRAVRDAGAIAPNVRRALVRLPAFVRAHRTGLAVLFAIAACVCMSAAAINFRPQDSDDDLDDGLAWMALGVVAMGAALGLAGERMRSPSPAGTPLNPTRSRWGWIVLGVVILAADAEISGRLLGLKSFYAVSPHVQFLLLSIGVALVTWGFGGAPSLRVHVRLTDALLIGAIFLLALVLRVAELDSSVRTLVDEVHWINGIQHLWWTPNPGLLTTSSTYLPTTQVYSYWETSLIGVFGRTLAGLRMTSAIVGALNVLAVYGLARALFDRKTALAAALVLATFPPHLHFSRIAMAHVGDTLFGTLALAFVARGIRFNRRMDWAIGGAALGLTQYFYEGGRLLFPALATLWLAWLMAFARGHLRAQWRGLVAAALTAFFVAAPVYYVIFARGTPLTSRLDDAGLGRQYWQGIALDGVTSEEVEHLTRRLTFPFQVYVHQPELAVYYGGEQALILAVLVPLALLGAGVVLWRWRSPPIVIAFWIVATAFGNSLIRDSAQYPRYVVVFPALALLMAVGASTTLTLLLPDAKLKPASGMSAAERLEAMLQMALRPAALVIVVALASLVQTVYYFGPHLAQFNRQIRESKPYPDGTDAVIRSLSLPEDTQVYLISEPAHDVNVPRNMLGFLRDVPANMPLEVLSPSEITLQMLRELPRDRNYAFFVQPQDIATINLLHGVFYMEPPQISPYADVPPEKQYVLYFAPKAVG